VLLIEIGGHLRNNDKFWDMVQLGKWRQFVVRRQMENNLFRASYFFLVLVIYYASIQIWLSYYPSTLPKTDFLTPLSIAISIALATIGMAIGFQSYFIQKEVGAEILSYYGLIDYQGIRGLVTFINKGENTAAIRNISLFVVRDIGGITASLRHRFSGLPSFEILHSETILQGWKILKEGESTGVAEENIKQAINETASELGSELNSEGLYFSVLVSDEAFQITDPVSVTRSLLGGCKLGPCSKFAKYAKGEMAAPGLFLGGQKTYAEVPANELVPAKMRLVPEVPPDVTDMNYEIWKKLDNIEKLLLEMTKKNNGKEKKQKPSNP
jgi:hypothetical protein